LDFAAAPWIVMESLVQREHRALIHDYLVQTFVWEGAVRAV
jgi:hypothetical protein